MVVQEHFNDLVVATYGRGFWIMDDITPLQQLTDEVVASDVHLFDPRPTYRMHSQTGGARANATANINYYLKDVPSGPVQIEILDDRGQTVNTLRGTSRPGINRVSWNLRHETVQQARLRTKPPGNPTVVEEKRFRTTWEREGWYPILSWGTTGGFQGITVAPGTYTVKLSVADQEYTRDLVVRKDPRSDGTLADIRAQVAMQLELRDDVNTVAGMIDDIERIKRQLVDLNEALEREDAPAVHDAAEELAANLQALEDKMLQPIAAEGDSKSFRFPNMLYSKLSVLAGDLAQSVDFAPNRQQREVHQVLKERMLQYQGELNDLLRDEVAVFNRMLRDLNLAIIT
jgi:hypothetical protein